MTAPKLRLFDFHRTSGRRTSSHRTGRAVYSASLKGRPRGVTVSAESQPLAIDVRGIRRVYATKPQPVVALQGVDLQVEPGEFFGLLGPNGAGKTTLIKILTTLLLPSDGTAHILLRRRPPDEADPPDHEHGRGRRAVGVRDPDRPRAALDVQPVLRTADTRRLAPGRRADRRGRDGGAARAARQHPVHRPASADELRPRPAQRPVDLLPRRADARPGRGRRSRRPRAGPRVEGRGPRPDGPSHDPLHAGGRRALRQDRDRRPRPDPRPRQPGRAQAPGPARERLPPRARPARGGPARSAAAGVLSAAAAAAQAEGQERQTVEVNLTLAEDSAWHGRQRARGRGALLALRKSEPSLEDVFVELVGRGFDEER